MKRIGPQMKAAVHFVTQNPGCAILPVAKYLHIGARSGRNNACGYNPVHRAIAAGLIRAEAGEHGAYRLYVVEAVK